jgi:hypothetical protein
MRKLALAVLALLTGCGPQTPSFMDVEDNKLTARENGKLVAQSWRAQQTQYLDWHIYSRGDSTIAHPKCPSGDGWVTVDLTAPNSAKTVQLKCSSYSKGTGCYTKTEFRERNLVDKACNNKLPFPLPNLGG